MSLAQVYPLFLRRASELGLLLWALEALACFGLMSGQRPEETHPVVATNYGRLRGMRKELNNEILAPWCSTWACPSPPRPWASGDSSRPRRPPPGSTCATPPSSPPSARRTSTACCPRSCCPCGFLSNLDDVATYIQDQSEDLPLPQHLRPHRERSVNKKNR
ncbi:neuroligin-2-like isoform X2 [Rhinoraja longicauda]